MITYDFENSCIRVDGEITFSLSNAEFFFWHKGWTYEECGYGSYIDPYDASEFLSEVEYDGLSGCETTIRAYPIKEGHGKGKIDRLIFAEFAVLKQVTATEFELKLCD